MGIKEKICVVFKSITVEPVVVLFLLPSVLLSLSIANLNLEKACRVKLQFNKTVCDGLTDRNTSMYTPEQENLVQKEVATMNAWKTIIQSLIPALLLLSFGAWSDKRRRRKPFMALPVIGEIITVTGLFLCTYFFYEFSMEVTGVVETLPNALTGGWFTMFMALFSYVADNSTLESRTVRFGAVNICNTASVMIGMALSGILYRVIGLYPIFAIAATMYALSLLYTIFVVKEKDVIKPSSKRRCAFLADFFNIQHVKSTFRVAYRNRRKNLRTRILASLVLLVLVCGPLYGEINVIYLYTRKQFQWSEVEFSIFYTINVVLHLIGTIFCLTVFSKYLQMDDGLLGILAAVSKFLAAFVFAFAPNQTVFYLGIFIEILSGTGFIALRSLASKLVESDELGKLYSLTGIFEALMPFAYGSLYNLIYKATITTLPGTFYLMGSFISIPTVGLFAWFYVQNRNDRKELEEKKKEEKLMDPNVIS